MIESREEISFRIQHVAVVLRGTRTARIGEKHEKGTKTLLKEKCHQIALKSILKGFV